MKVVYLEFLSGALEWVKKMANDLGFQKVTKSKGYQNIILTLKETTLWHSDSYVGRTIVKVGVKRRPCSFVKGSCFWVNSTNFDVVLSNQPYLTLLPLEIAIYLNFIKFSCQICRNLRTFHFCLKDLLCVKDMTFRNSVSGYCNRSLSGNVVTGPLLNSSMIHNQTQSSGLLSYPK